MMEAVRTSETSVFSKETTLRCIPESSHLNSRRENMKYLIFAFVGSFNNEHEMNAVWLIVSVRLYVHLNSRSAG
jgi:hypothetical protein